VYIHMGSDRASFRMVPEKGATQPYVREASGFIRNFSRDGRNLQFEAGGYYQPFVELAGMAGCTATDGRGIRKTRKSPDTWRLDLSGTVAQPVVYQTIRVHCE
jgi:hypothetical protein